MLEGIQKATHTFLQWGDNMQNQAAEHSSPIRDMDNVHGSAGCGRKKEKNAKGVVCVDQTAPNSQPTKLY